MKTFFRNLKTLFTVDLFHFFKANFLSLLSMNLDLEEKLDKLLWKAEGNKLILTIRNQTITTSGDINMAFQLKDTEQVVLTAKVVDAKGNPASLVGKGTWTVADATVVSVTAADDGLSATVVAGTTFATTTVTFEVDGVTATFDVTLVGGPAASATIEAGTPTEIPAPAPEEPAPEAPAEGDVATPVSV